MKFSGLYIALLVSLLSCKKENEIAYPLIQTGYVTDIKKTGAVFNAKIINLSNEEILEYGFVWDSISGVNVDKSERFVMTEPAKNGVFSQEITTTFKQDVKYYVKAYIKNYHFTTYGKEIGFKIAPVSGSTSTPFVNAGYFPRQPVTHSGSFFSEDE